MNRSFETVLAQLIQHYQTNLQRTKSFPDSFRWRCSLQAQAAELNSGNTIIQWLLNEYVLLRRKADPDKARLVLSHLYPYIEENYHISRSIFLKAVARLSFDRGIQKPASGQPPAAATLLFGELCWVIQNRVFSMLLNRLIRLPQPTLPSKPICPNPLNGCGNSIVIQNTNPKGTCINIPKEPLDVCDQNRGGQPDTIRPIDQKQQLMPSTKSGKGQSNSKPTTIDKKKKPDRKRCEQVKPIEPSKDAPVYTKPIQSERAVSAIDTIFFVQLCKQPRYSAMIQLIRSTFVDESVLLRLLSTPFPSELLKSSASTTQCNSSPNKCKEKEQDSISDRDKLLSSALSYVNQVKLKEAQLINFLLETGLFQTRMHHHLTELR